MARKPKPWYRAGRGWYTTVNNKQVPLNVSDPDAIREARDALDRILSGALGQQSNGGQTQFRPELSQTSVHTTEPEPAPDWRGKAAAWLAHKTKLKLKAKTLKDYRWNLDRWLSYFADRPRAEVTAEAIVEQSHSFGWGTNQRRHYIRTAQGFLAWCGIDLKGIDCPGHKSAGAKSLISEATHRRVVAAAPPGDVAALLWFLWHTGCRPCEACNLVAESVDWTNSVAKLREHKTASKGKTRILYLSEPALAVLVAQKAKHGATGPLFRCESGRPYLRTSVTTILNRLSKKIGASVTAYGYRHTYATRALELGLSDTHVAALLGHTSTQMIHKHYSHLSENARLLKQVADKIAVPHGAMSDAA